MIKTFGQNEKPTPQIDEISAHPVTRWINLPLFWIHLADSLRLALLLADIEPPKIDCKHLTHLWRFTIFKLFLKIVSSTQLMVYAWPVRMCVVDSVFLTPSPDEQRAIFVCRDFTWNCQNKFANVRELARTRQAFPVVICKFCTFTCRWFKDLIWHLASSSSSPSTTQLYFCVCELCAHSSD